MKYFTIPDSPGTFNLNINLFKLMKEHPDWFYSDFKILYAFGCPQGCFWNGGFCYSNPDQKEDIKAVENRLKEYYNNDIHYLFTFSNYKLKDYHYKDEYANSIARLGNIPGNGAIVASEEMRSFLNLNYSNLSVINSVIYQTEDIDQLNEILSKNKMTLKVSLNKNFEKLKLIKNPENIILLCNEYCVENCKFKKEHHDNYCLYNILEEEKEYNCPYITNSPSIEKEVTLLNEEVSNNIIDQATKEKQITMMEGPTRTHWIFKEDFKKYEEMGIHNFKIQGRSYNNYLALKAYLDYFVKEDKRKMVEDILEKC